MKPFDLEAAKRGEPIVTRDGRKAKFLTYAPDAKSEKLVCLVNGEVLLYLDDGSFVSPNVSKPLDLFMAPPPMRSINGHEYPEPVWEPLENGQEYWVANLFLRDLVVSCLWGDTTKDFELLTRGLIQSTKEGAQAQGRAIILAGGVEV